MALTWTWGPTLPAVHACLTMRQIVASVAFDHGLPVRDVIGPARFRPLVLARQEAMYLASLQTRKDGSRAFSLPQIGRYFCRDHTTVLWAIRRHRARLACEFPGKPPSHSAEAA